MGFRLLPLVHLGFRQLIALCPLPARLASDVLGDTPGFTVGSDFLSNFSSITNTYFVAQRSRDLPGESFHWLRTRRRWFPPPRVAWGNTTTWIGLLSEPC